MITENEEGDDKIIPDMQLQESVLKCLIYRENYMNWNLLL